MTRTITIAPVRKSIVVQAPVARAFDVFTAGIDRWWPKQHSLGSSPMVKSVIEPRVGGRWFTVHEDGSESVVGHMLAWQPPHRMVFTWAINANWKADATVASEVEVTFASEGPNVTRVMLEHRNFESLGEQGGAKLREDVNGGWPGLLDLFAKEAERSAR